jgi:HYDIN/CFA65/VesB family protein
MAKLARIASRSRRGPAHDPTTHGASIDRHDHVPGASIRARRAASPATAGRAQLSSPFHNEGRTIMNHWGGFSNFSVPVLTSMVVGCFLVPGTALAQLDCGTIDCAPGFVCVDGQGCVPDGSPPLYQATPTTLSFGTVTVGESKVDSFAVFNLGLSADLVITSVVSSNAVFRVSPASATVGLPFFPAPGGYASQTFYVTFSPVAGGKQSALIVLMHNAWGSPDTVTVDGNDLATPVTRRTWGRLKTVYR